MKRKKQWNGPKYCQRLWARFDEEARRICGNIQWDREGSERLERILEGRQRGEPQLTMDGLIAEVVRRARTADEAFALDVGSGLLDRLDAVLGVTFEVQWALDDLEAEIDPAFRMELEEQRKQDEEDALRRRQSGRDPDLEIARAKEEVRRVARSRFKTE